MDQLGLAGDHGGDRCGQLERGGQRGWCDCETPPVGVQLGSIVFRIGPNSSNSVPFGLLDHLFDDQCWQFKADCPTWGEHRRTLTAR